MISLREAKILVMDAHYLKHLEIFHILENKDSWIFIINGINEVGKIILPQPFVRLVKKENGEITPLVLERDKKLISSFKTIYDRKQTLLESTYLIESCYNKYIILQVYESENYHKFILKQTVFNVRSTVILDRTTSKAIDEKKVDLSNEIFIRKQETN